MTFYHQRLRDALGQIDTATVQRPGAFLGRITTAVRDRAAARLSEAGDGTVLDVGCGNGLFFAGCGPASASRFGIDLDLALLKEAGDVFQSNRVQPAHLARADAWALPFSDGCFDNVLLLNTLINIPTDQGVADLLAELMRVCSPTGKVYVDIRNAANPLLRLRYWQHNKSADFVTRAYSIGKIDAMFGQNGFRLAHTDRIGPRIPLLSLGSLLVYQRCGEP